MNLRRLVLSAAILWLPCQQALADGAFPDSLAVLVPAGHPHEIVLATNFGPLISEDDGATWRWVCEQAIALLVSLYQVGPPPGDTLFAMDDLGLHRANVEGVRGCTWSASGGSLTGAFLADVFPDPGDPKHVLAIASVRTDSSSPPMALFESKDGAATFGNPLYETRAAESVLESVEIARSAPKTVYITRIDYLPEADPRTFVLRSTDGAATFQSFDQTATLGASRLRIAAVDPTDPSKLFLRVLGTGGKDQLAVSSDGGATLHVTLSLPEPMSAFLLRGDKTVLVGTRRSGSFVSKDGGMTFVPWANAPHLRGLGERGTTLFAVGDNFADGFAIARSEDSGGHWTPLLRYADIAGPLQCPNIQTVCADPWSQLVSLFGIWTAPDAPDGGLTPAPPVKGCGCAVGQPGPTHLVEMALLLCGAVVVGMRKRPRARRGERRS